VRSAVREYVAAEAPLPQKRAEVRDLPAGFLARTVRWFRRPVEEFRDTLDLALHVWEHKRSLWDRQARYACDGWDWDWGVCRTSADGKVAEWEFTGPDGRKSTLMCRAPTAGLTGDATGSLLALDASGETEAVVKLLEEFLDSFPYTQEITG
jgi:hypothetical protein